MSEDARRDLFSALAAANPLPAAEVSARAEPERDRILALIHRRISETTAPERKLRRPRVVAAAALALAVLIAVPALAATGKLASLLGFSNPGIPVKPESLSLSELSVLKRVGADAGTVKLLGERGGIAFYVGRSRTGALCFGIGKASASMPSFTMLECPAAGSSSFPSPAQPVADFSLLKGREGDPNVYLWRLAGFAADGVARVGFIDPSGQIHSVPVENNIYAATEPPQAPATALVALDAAGDVIWRDPLLEQREQN